ncbi:hypothetical protein IQ241_03075 [Romeria aff. gracilis LEGE 07310]|uniref:Uncharacterized protein n=1 Tax=Vasconcelosia minhoensis LEGE 07310 TaxID=915328 RepID=A0A8J7AVE1_9CYAN|nr:hypothetical protein [Romeria gracilis]MBE9076287.1 hypothetical protein [Romeria aff. gracilis LEGE 07310]
MYNLFIGYAGPKDPDDSVEVSVSRFLEYTDDETRMRFRDLTGDAVRKIMDYPALFMHEHYEDGAFVAEITSIKEVGRSYKVEFRQDTQVGVISPDIISAAALELRIGEFEFYRTHWAVKQGDLLDILSRHKSDLENQQSRNELPENEPATDDSEFNKSQGFIVHGH